MSIIWHEYLSSPPSIVGPVHRKEFIAIHWYGDPRTAGDVHATARYLAGVAHASVNYVAGDGHAYCLVNPTQIAYGQGDGGDGYGNKHGISIECDPRMKPIDLETVAHVIAKIRKDFGINFPLRPHNHFTATQCPGVWEGKLQWLSDRADRINAGGIIAAPAAPPVPAINRGPYVPDPHWIVEPNETLSQIAAYYKVSVAAIQKFNAIKNANVIHVGERIWPPKGHGTWIVQQGQTLSGISAWFAERGHRVTVPQLQNANGINNPNTDLKVGMRLLIP